MKKNSRFVAALICLFAWSIFSVSPTLAQTCAASNDRHAVKIMGKTDNGELNPFIPPEIYGGHNFAQQLDNGWVFKLGASQYGWKIYLFGNDGSAPNIDMAQVTPPHRTAPNPRDIEGWHFRNAANTGPNLGDVNAPQQLREFFFSQSLIGTGGFKSSRGPDAPLMFEPDPKDGRGWLKILDFGLSDIEPGKKARMTYLKFNACISWPKTDEDKRIEADNKNPIYLPEEIETFGACGVDLSKYELKAHLLPRLLSGDMDGDGAIDQIAQITRKRDGRRGLAVCRAGTYLDVIGMEKTGSSSGYLRANTWKLLAKDSKIFGYVGEPDRPKMDGDMLVFESPEKFMTIIYWASGKLNTQNIYGFVQP